MLTSLCPEIRTKTDELDPMDKSNTLSGNMFVTSNTPNPIPADPDFSKKALVIKVACYMV